MKKILNKLGLYGIKEGSVVFKIVFWLVVISIVIQLIVAGFALLHLGDKGAAIVLLQMVAGIVINYMAAAALARAAWPLDSYERVYGINTNEKTRSCYE